MRLNIVILTGAGISAESGLPTFRDKDGLWQKFDWKRLASASAFYEGPKAVLDFYNTRRKHLLNVKPNHAHIVLAELEKYHNVSVITQNVDDLHERAGSTNVIHLHGELTKVTSSLHRLDPDCIESYPLDKPIEIGDKAKDGSQLRPYILWFGEYINSEDYGKAVKIAKDADVFVIIGSSLNVAPASGLANYVHPVSPKFVIDPADLSTKLPSGFTHIRKCATEGIDDFMAHLEKLMEIYR